MSTVGIIPIHKRMTSEEVFAINKGIEILSNVDFLFMAEDKSLCNTFGSRDIYVPPSGSLSSLLSYNNLLLDRHFYSNFSQYDHMLIFQHDCIVFNNFLSDFYDFNFVGSCFNRSKIVNDYWFSRTPRFGHALSKLSIGSEMLFGNGGFSLRNIDFCTNHCPNNIWGYAKALNGSNMLSVREDIYWSWISRDRSSNKSVIDRLQRFGVDRPNESSDIDFNNIMVLHGSNVSAPILYRQALTFLGYRN